MTDKSAYFEKPYRYNHKIDEKIIIDIFNIVGNLNINDLKIKMMVEQIPYNIVDNQGNTLYHKVLMDDDLLKTENQRLQMIKFLYNENCNPDAPNNMNITPFHLACMKQYESIIDFFIDINININYKDSYGNTPLHKLLVGNIKLEEKTNIGKLFPSPPKTQDLIKYDNIKELKQNIWNDIKNSKFIKSIDETLKFNIDLLDNTTDIETLKLYIDKLVFNNLDMTKHDKVAKLTEITNIGVNKFKTNIEKQWGNFANISEIELHKTTPNSYPKNDPSDISILKFRNYKKYLFDKITSSIEQLIEIFNNKLVFEDINVNLIYQDLFQEFIDNNKDDIINNGSKLDVILINDDLNFKNKYEEFNNIFSTNITYDFADNIIDLKNKIFIGGNRQIIIKNDFKYDNDIFKKNPDQIISSFLYTLVLPITDAIKFDTEYDLYNLDDPDINNLYNNIIEFIYKIINNDDVNKDINIITDNIDNYNLINFYPVRDLLLRSNINLNTIEYYEKIKYIYYLMNLFLVCKNKQENKLTDTVIIMNIHCILFIAGMINNKTDDLIYSIEQCCKPLLLNIICDDNKYGFISTSSSLSEYHQSYSILICYIYALFSNEEFNFIVDNIINTNIDVTNVNIDEELTKVINSLNIVQSLNQILLEVIELFNNRSSSKKLVKMIIEYYNELEQGPQSLHVADLIAIIRDFNNVKPSNLLNRLKNLLIKTYDFKDVDKNIFIDNINININDDFYSLINDNEYAETMKLINEYSLPSRANYYIYLDNKRYDDFCSYKFIESYYLGLNFMGVVPYINPINEITVDNGGSPETITTTVNLFNFNLDSLNYDNNFINEINPRPTTIFTVAYIFNDYFMKMGNMINKCFDILRLVFNYFKQSTSSTKYMIAIINLYPILLNLLNNCKLIDKYKTDIINKYSEQFNYINSKTGIDIENTINKFNYSKFSIKHFENIINNINGLIFILYYVSDKYYDSDDEQKVKIPKLLYYSLGSKPLIAFDSDDKIDITLPETVTEGKITDTEKFDNMRKDIQINVFFENVIKNNLFLYKNVLYDDYIISRKQKLPPSINELFYEFYKINIIKTIIQKLDEDEYDDNLSEDELDSLDDKDKDIIIERKLIEKKILNIPDNLNYKIKRIQLKYIKAKIIEELLKVYFKNRVIKYANKKYELHFLENIKSSQDINIQQMFKYNELKYGFDNEDRYNEYKEIINIDNNNLKFFYEFTNPKSIEKQFYLYPDNYFSTNRLNNKLVVLIKKDILNMLLEGGCNILEHNNERISPLNMIIKNYYYDCIDIIKSHVDLRIIDKDYSPYNYLLSSYKLHLENYNNFYYNQYNDIVQIIQANENFYNNIPKYLETSFKIIKYITEQYLTENMPNTDNFNKIGYTFDICPFLRAINNNDVRLLKDDVTLIISELFDKFKKIKDNIQIKINILEADKKVLNDSNRNSKLIDNKISKLKQELELYDIKQSNSSPYENITISKIDEKDIITRYKNIMNNTENLSYLNGWEQFLNREEKNTTSLPIKLINFQITNMINNTSNNFNENLQLILPFYKKNYDIIKDYFERQRYINKNDVVKFVYELLLHLTKTFICSSIETVIKKVLFEYISQIEISPVEFILAKVDYIFDPVKEHLYNIIPEIFVSNSVNIYTQIDDSLNKEIQTVSMILNNLLDLLKSSSPIEIDEYTINLLKNNFVMYFDTIVWKTINNWNVVIENIFMFHINQYRILECINKLLN